MTPAKHTPPRRWWPTPQSAVVRNLFTDGMVQDLVVVFALHGTTPARG
jgi:hypothetical protein